MGNSFILLPVFAAVLDWIVISRRSKWEFITKPGMMILLLIWVGGSAISSQEVFPWGGLVWFFLGGIASTFGDIFLMLPKERFIAGLVSFALAHIAYVIGLNTNQPELNLAGWIVIVLVVLVAYRVFRRLQGGLQASGHTSLVGPVLFYTAVISVMLISALLTLTGSHWSAGPALLVSSGALLFFLSDTILAWNRFVAPISGEKLKVRMTYHLGQIGILTGAVMNFLIVSSK